MPRFPPFSGGRFGSLATPRRTKARRRARLLGRFLLLMRLERLTGEVEAETEVVEEVEDREAQEQSVGLRHLQQDSGVAYEPEAGEREREPAKGDGARRVDISDGR